MRHIERQISQRESLDSDVGEALHDRLDNGISNLASAPVSNEQECAGASCSIA